MPRRVQDILPNERRSIREIPVEKPVPTFIDDSKKRRSRDDDESEKDIRDVKKGLSNIPIHRIHEDKPERMNLTPPARPVKKNRKGRLKWLGIFFIIIILVAGLGYIASLYYSKATFTIVPKSIPLSANGTFVSQYTSGTSNLSYSLITLTGSASTTISATNGAMTSTKAQGKVTLYNSYSNTPVRLIAGTRLANDNGLVYRLDSSIVIPGMTGASTPGKLVTNITADVAGQEYNVSNTDSISDFKVVAYKGTPRYETIYARIASPFAGGYLGVKKIIDNKALASTSEQLSASITAKLLTEALANVPEGYIMFDNAYVSIPGEVKVTGEANDSAIVSRGGTMYGIIFKRQELVSKISNNASDSAFGDIGYEDPDFSSFKFTISNPKEFSPTKKNSLIFQLKGAVSLYGNIPVEEIKNKLAGLSLNSTTDVLREYSSVIKTSSGDLVPKWAKVPSDPDRVNVVIEKE